MNKDDKQVLIDMLKFFGSCVVGFPPLVLLLEGVWLDGTPATSAQLIGCAIVALPFMSYFFYRGFRLWIMMWNAAKKKDRDHLYKTSQTASKQ